MTLDFIDNEICQNKNQWKAKQNYFIASKETDFEDLVVNYQMQVRNNLLSETFMLIEHDLRTFGENITNQITHTNINTVKDQLIKKLKLDIQHKYLLDIIFHIRNSIHNAGLLSKDIDPITFKGELFEFSKNKDTKTSLDRIEILLNEILIFAKVLFSHEASVSVVKWNIHMCHYFPNNLITSE
ncbi:MAG: hypothetical protein IPH33_12755 [Bacteroidetes bacterium]|nr:hypothetical protein [Bacteroidota bacterium]